MGENEFCQRGRTRLYAVEDGVRAGYSFSFVPKFDVTATLSLMGAYGEKTCYDDVRVEGAVLGNGGFEEEGSWRVGLDTQGLSDVTPPYLYMCNPPLGIAATEGRRIACITHERQLAQSIRLQKCRKVTVRFKARAMVCK